MPTDMPKVQTAALSKELSEPIPEPPTFEGKPGVRTVAGDLGNEYVLVCPPPRTKTDRPDASRARSSS